MQWRVNTDTFGFDVNVKERPPMRRGSLSIIGSVFAPFGFAAPFVLTAKKILQDLCKMKLGWLRKYLQSTMYVGEKIACRPSYAVKASDQPLFSTSQLWDHRL